MNVPGFEHPRIDLSRSIQAPRPLDSRIRPLESFADAVAAGNNLLFLPSEIRQQIYSEVIKDETVDADEINLIRIRWLPTICRTSVMMFNEGLPVFLEKVMLVIGSFATAYNLHHFLTLTDEFNSVRRLAFDISVFDTFSNAAGLIQHCPNLREVQVRLRCFNLKTLGKSVEEFAKDFIFEQLLQLRNIKVVIFDGSFACISKDMEMLAKWMSGRFKEGGQDVNVIGFGAQDRED